MNALRRHELLSGSGAGSKSLKRLQSAGQALQDSDASRLYTLQAQSVPDNGEQGSPPQPAPVTPQDKAFVFRQLVNQFSDALQAFMTTLPSADTSPSEVLASLEVQGRGLRKLMGQVDQQLKILGL